MIDLMESIRVYKFSKGAYVEMNRDFPWKRGIIFTVKSLIELQNSLLIDHDYKSVFLGHFTQDAVEHFFSMMRSKISNPTPSQAAACIKKIAMGRYMEEVPRTSYEFANGMFMLDLHDGLQKNKNIFTYTFESLPLTSNHDKELLVYIYGASVYSILKIHLHDCKCKTYLM
jgi:hypothetical protein